MVEKRQFALGDTVYINNLSDTDSIPNALSSGCPSNGAKKITHICSIPICV